jgi:DNA-binding PadR family transcriptional regulator
VTGTRPAGLTPAGFQILLALADGDRHGYEIMQAIARDSQGAIRPGPTTLYRSIRVLLQAGLIEESDRRPEPEHDDERRRYYRLTPSGWEAARLETERLRRLLAVADSRALTGRGRPRLAKQS